MKQPYQHPDMQTTSTLDFELQGKPLIELLQEILLKGVDLRLHARGSSMMPFILDGDLITIMPARNKTPLIGDVIAFHHPQSENLVVHRVILRKQDVLIVKGDNEPRSLSENVRKEEMIGILKCVERDGRLVRFGIGPEKVLISWMSRIGFLVPLRLALARLRGRTSVAIGD